jgi:biotin carboxylase
MTEETDERKRVLLLMTPATYRAGAFLSAADAAGVEIVQGVELPPELAERWNVPLALNFADPEGAAEAIAEFAQDTRLDAILAVDDSGTLIASLASARLGLRHNAPEAALAARDKWVMRSALAAGGVGCPIFTRFSIDDDPVEVAAQVPYPCVLKPLRMNGSRGVIRANDPSEFVAAFERVRRILAGEGSAPGMDQVLVESYIPGCEVALEGLVTRGDLRVLALFDKPDPLDGPFFEETIYVTPSRLAPDVQQAIADCVQGAVRALGLREGPVHAELRVNEAGPWMLEIAGRSIGGLCSGVLRFGTDVCLEELILRHAGGLELPSIEREGQAAGVMMIPIPKAGVLHGYSGVEEARAVPGIEGVEITARRHYPLVPLPEGNSYLGFIFARGDAPEEVEAALREAHRRLSFDIKPELPLLRAARTSAPVSMPGEAAVREAVG